MDGNTTHTCLNCKPLAEECAQLKLNLIKLEQTVQEQAHKLQEQAVLIESLTNQLQEYERSSKRQTTKFPRRNRKKDPKTARSKTWSQEIFSESS